MVIILGKRQKSWVNHKWKRRVWFRKERLFQLVWGGCLPPQHSVRTNTSTQHMSHCDTLHSSTQKGSWAPVSHPLFRKHLHVFSLMVLSWLFPEPGTLSIFVLLLSIPWTLEMHVWIDKGAETDEETKGTRQGRPVVLRVTSRNWGILQIRCPGNAIHESGGNGKGEFLHRLSYPKLIK